MDLIVCGNSAGVACGDALPGSRERPRHGCAGLRDEVSRVGSERRRLRSDDTRVVHAGARHAMRAPRRPQPGGGRRFDAELMRAVMAPLDRA